MMKKVLFFMGFVLIVILVACSGGQESSGVKDTIDEDSQGNEKVEFRLGALMPVGDLSPGHVIVDYFIDQVQKNSDGIIQIKEIPDGQLGNGIQMFESVADGTLDMAHIAVASLDSFTSDLSGLTLPFLITDTDVEYKMYNSEVILEGIENLEEFGVKGFALAPSGMKHYGVKGEPIKTLADFEGRKMRGPESPIMNEALAYMGMDVTPTPLAEVYTALDTGVIDGMDQPLATWWTNNFYEVVDSISLTHSYAWPMLIIMNLETFNNLSDDQRSQILDAGESTQKFMVEEGLPDIEEEILKMLKEEVNVIEDVNIESFKEKMKPFYKQKAEDDPYIKRVIEAVNDIESNK